MVTMSAIWDRTAQVLRGRGSMLAGIAILLTFVPAVAQDAASAYGGRTPGAVMLAGLLGMVVGLLAIWSNLALVAAASDPLVDRAAAFRIGGRRLPLGLGLSILLILALVLVSVPGLVLLAGAVDLTRMTNDGMATLAGTTAPGRVFGAGLYFLVFGIAMIWLSARLSLFWPVLVNERRGIGTFARSFELTRGLTWRIVGVTILFVVLLLVALSAAQLVAALFARLLLGADGAATARFVGAVAGAAVSTASALVAATFMAQLYRVVSGREAAHTFA